MNRRAGVALATGFFIVASDRVSAAAEPRAAAPEVAPDDQTLTIRSGSRARTMEDVSEESSHELRLGGTRARYSLNFFGDTSFSLGHPAEPDRFPSFAIGAQDFLLKGELGNHIVATTEFALEPHEGGTVVDVERLHVRWQTDAFFFEAGRVHTAFGYWNNAYHHGSWLQPTIERPRWVAFEDDAGILPVHWVGIDMGLKLKSGYKSFNVYASIGNGRGKIVDDVRTDRDYQAMKAFHLALEYVGLIVPDLRIGVSGIYDRIPPQPATIRPIFHDVFFDEFIFAAHIAYPSVPLIFIAEAYWVSHAQAANRWTTYGGFALLGYSLGPFIPYLQYERIASTGGLDPFFVPDPAAEGIDSFDTVQGIVGLRVDLSAWTALKFEYRYTDLLDRSFVTHQGIVNWSWGF